MLNRNPGLVTKPPDSELGTADVRHLTLEQGPWMPDPQSDSGPRSRIHVPGMGSGVLDPSFLSMISI